MRDFSYGCLFYFNILLNCFLWSDSWVTIKDESNTQRGSMKRTNYAYQSSARALKYPVSINTYTQCRPSNHQPAYPLKEISARGKMPRRHRSKSSKAWHGPPFLSSTRKIPPPNAICNWSTGSLNNLIFPGSKNWKQNRTRTMATYALSQSHRDVSRRDCCTSLNYDDWSISTSNSKNP